MTARAGRDFNDVFVFVRVVQAKSFTGAGRALGMPTSTVSRRVRRLEEELGVQLLQRTTRKLSLTEAGELYYARSRPLFDGIEEAEGMLAEHHEAPQGRVRVTAPAEHTITAQLAAQFLERYPEVRLEVELSSRSVNLIEEGFDVGLTAGELSNLSLVAHKLIDSAFQIVAAPAYLRRQGRPRRVRDLSAHQCLLFGAPGSPPVWRLSSPDGPIRVPVTPRATFDHLRAVHIAALAGLGIAVLPRLICGADVRAGRLVSILPKAAPPPVPVWVTFRGGRYIPPAVRAFVDFTRGAFPALARAQMDPDAGAA